MSVKTVFSNTDDILMLNNTQLSNIKNKTTKENIDFNRKDTRLDSSLNTTMKVLSVFEKFDHSRPSTIEEFLLFFKYNISTIYYMVIIWNNDFTDQEPMGTFESFYAIKDDIILKLYTFFFDGKIIISKYLEDHAINTYVKKRIQNIFNMFSFLCCMSYGIEIQELTEVSFAMEYLLHLFFVYKQTLNKKLILRNYYSYDSSFGIDYLLSFLDQDIVNKLLVFVKKKEHWLEDINIPSFKINVIKMFMSSSAFLISISTNKTIPVKYKGFIREKPNIIQQTKLTVSILADNLVLSERYIEKKQKNLKRIIDYFLLPENSQEDKNRIIHNVIILLTIRHYDLVQGFMEFLKEHEIKFNI